MSVPSTEKSFRLGTWLMMFHGQGLLERLASKLDFVRLDMEHTAIDEAEIARVVERGTAAGLDVCVRPSSYRPQDILRALGTGARRLYVPQVDSAEAAELVVDTVREVLGDGTKVHISVMLESALAFENRDAVAAVDGIDLLAIGPADLAQNLGIYGDADEDKRIDHYRYLLRDTALANGKLWEIGVWSEANARRWIGEGCPVVTYMTDTSALREKYTSALKVMAECRAKHIEF